jgi:hypothetical protein
VHARCGPDGFDVWGLRVDRHAQENRSVRTRNKCLLVGTCQASNRRTPLVDSLDRIDAVDRDSRLGGLRLDHTRVVVLIE